MPLTQTCTYRFKSVFQISPDFHSSLLRVSPDPKEFINYIYLVKYGGDCHLKDTLIVSIKVRLCTGAGIVRNTILFSFGCI